MDNFMSSILLVNLNLLCFYAIRYLSYSTQKLRDDNERMDNFIKIFTRYLETLYPHITENNLTPEKPTSETFTTLIKKYQISDAETQTETDDEADEGGEIDEGGEETNEGGNDEVDKTQ